MTADCLQTNGRTITPFHCVVFVSRAISHHLHLEFRYTVFPIYGKLFSLYGMSVNAGLCYRK